MDWMRMGLAFLLSLACLAGDRKGGRLREIPSKLLGRTVVVALHIPDPAVVSSWQARHPGARLSLVLFLPGAYDTAVDLLDQGIYEDLALRESQGSLQPALWAAVTHFRGWYADRADGTFPYERYLREELIPLLEREHPQFGGSPSSRAVAGLSMGGFGALNLAGRTGLFSRCAALSPALVEPPFGRTGFWLRRSLRRTFGEDPEGFAPWNPWRHLGGGSELYLGCGRQDKYRLAEATEAFAARATRPGRTVRLSIRDGGHDWDYWTPEFKRLAGWLGGGEPLAR
jgi:hypothetical protein